MKNYNLISDKSVFELITKTRSIGLLIETSVLTKCKNAHHFRCKTKLNDVHYSGRWWAELDLHTLILRIIASNKKSKENISFYLSIICVESLNDIDKGEIHAK